MATTPPTNIMQLPDELVMAISDLVTSDDRLALAFTNHHMRNIFWGNYLKTTVLDTSDIGRAEFAKWEKLSVTSLGSIKRLILLDRGTTWLNRLFATVINRFPFDSLNLLIAPPRLLPAAEVARLFQNQAHLRTMVLFWNHNFSIRPEITSIRAAKKARLLARKEGRSNDQELDSDSESDSPDVSKEPEAKKRRVAVRTTFGIVEMPIARHVTHLDLQLGGMFGAPNWMLEIMCNVPAITHLKLSGPIEGCLTVNDGEDVISTLFRNAKRARSPIELTCLYFRGFAFSRRSMRVLNEGVDSETIAQLEFHSCANTLVSLGHYDTGRTFYSVEELTIKTPRQPMSLKVGDYSVDEETLMLKKCLDSYPDLTILDAEVQNKHTLPSFNISLLKQTNMQNLRAFRMRITKGALDKEFVSADDIVALSQQCPLLEELEIVVKTFSWGPASRECAPIMKALVELRNVYFLSMIGNHYWDDENAIVVGLARQMGKVGLISLQQHQSPWDSVFGVYGRERGGDIDPRLVEFTMDHLRELGPKMRPLLPLTNMHFKHDPKFVGQFEEEEIDHLRITEMLPDF